VSSYSVYLLSSAKQDLLELHRYVALQDSVERADSLLNKLYEACLTLKAMPDRGRNLSELEKIGIRDFKEIILKPYRTIYGITGSRAFVYCILDGRRDLQDLLEERLLR
jgi:toxin ParE1/3/4